MTRDNFSSAPEWSILRNPDMSRQTVLAASLLILMQLTGIACQRSNVSPVRIQLEDLPAEKSLARSTPSQPPPVCPAAGLAPLTPATRGTGDHKVTLTWKASAPSNDSLGAAVGYCLYRSKTRQAAKKNPVCKHCEQVNRVPIASIGCVDDLVADSARYYYVVTAINLKGTLSAPSNEIPVTIPPANQSAAPARPNSLPLCRATGP